MKFGEILEYHKIPEWYSMYLNYELFKQMIDLFCMKKKCSEVVMLPGYYFSTSDGTLVKLDIHGGKVVQENGVPEPPNSAQRMVGPEVADPEIYCKG
jgi:hypothetical protein